MAKWYALLCSGGVGSDTTSGLAIDIFFLFFLFLLLLVFAMLAGRYP